MATEQIIDLCTTTHCFGEPVRERSHALGDNKPIANSAAAPHAKLHKCHSALSFHRVCEAIAGKFVAFHWIDGSLNPSGTLGKRWGQLESEASQAPSQKQTCIGRDEGTGLTTETIDWAAMVSPF
jgi:hypothetical protein